MEQITIVTCDDSRMASDIVAGAVRSVFGAKDIPIEIKSYYDPEDLLAYCSKHMADLALLDIEMPLMSGIELGKALRERNMVSEIIYISNREDQVFAALQTHPFGFIRKAHFMKDAEDILGSWADQYKRREDAARLVVVTEDGYRNVEISEILYFEGSGSYQQMFLAGKEQPIRIASRMKILEEQLTGQGFLRIHKGFMVNCRHISTIQTGEIVMKNGVSLPISRGKTAEIKSEYLAFCRENGMMLF